MFLSGKTALITGSTSGIGLAYAKALAAEGANVVINGFGDADEIETERKDLAAKSGAQAIYINTDLTTAEGCEELMQGAFDKFGAVDILINNAGMQHVAPIEEFPVDKWNKIIALNLGSSFHTCRLAVPKMKEKGWGRIIMTASAHSLTASPFKAAYVSAKHGLAGLTKTLALELAQDNITVNCLSPGYVWTPLVEDQIPDTMKARGMTRDEVINEVLLEREPTKKFTQPDDLAALALFLCRDVADNITGANISADGGWTAQ
ncbi:3-hydroxybutyrate dehydrogenase [Croceicoccus pelagius]|uniref:3-hydroxybutyrate dehydrogenase n=1 Tax=Croceicoccus pelagius TaxID=1703341 RepID=A0A916YHA7_9SPHN|nr:3-hydroxybutyrate dehydrogenase [Croceicoccus pelagius]GGD44140.1 3-hydroxybutyrate dehydrogenase [Croceicoccus pelagius]